MGDSDPIPPIASQQVTLRCDEIVTILINCGSDSLRTVARRWAGMGTESGLAPDAITRHRDVSEQRSLKGANLSYFTCPVDTPELEIHDIAYLFRHQQSCQRRADCYHIGKQFKFEFRRSDEVVLV